MQVSFGAKESSDFKRSHNVTRQSTSPQAADAISVHFGDESREERLLRDEKMQRMLGITRRAMAEYYGLKIAEDKQVGPGELRRAMALHSALETLKLIPEGKRFKDVRPADIENMRNNYLLDPLLIVKQRLAQQSEISADANEIVSVINRVYDQLEWDGVRRDCLPGHILREMLAKGVLSPGPPPGSVQYRL